MLKCSTSLWSADLTNLAAEVKRVEPFSERFHIDVCDGHYCPELLFFPSLVEQLRVHTQLPFEIHLMTADPRLWAQRFADAGGDLIVFAWDCADDPKQLLEEIHEGGKQTGISLRIDEPISLVEPMLDDLDVLIVCATDMGIKGASMDPSIPDKIRAAKRLIADRGVSTVVEVDGGIRRTSVPLLAEAGADFIVPGSLMFGEDPADMRAWLATL
jgi:ribulose-phosphate 3-epimerase